MKDGLEKLIKELIDSGYLKTPRIIEAFKKIDRQDFVLPESKNEAYGNYPLSIGRGQTISQPLTVAFMLELLAPRPGEKILDVGHGSGWQTSMLAEIVGEKGEIIAVERVPELCAMGEKNMSAYGFIEKRAIKTICGDGTLGAPEHAPFDKIIAAAAATKELPSAWKKQLKIGGIIVAPVGGSIWRLTKKSESDWQEEEFPGFAFVPLVAGKLPEPNTSKKITKAKKVVFLPLAFFLITIVMSFSVHALIAKFPAEPTRTEVEIHEGVGAKEIGALLKNKKLIRSKWLFVAWIVLTGKTSNLKHGIYEFNSSLNVPELASRLVKGERFSNEAVITIPEGWNLETIAEAIAEEGIITKEKFFFVAGRPRQKFQPTEIQKSIFSGFVFLKNLPAGANLEGYLFPDTYRFFVNDAAENVVKKMLENFDKKLSLELRAEIAKRQKNVHEIITMASLIEKEVRSDEDRALVSGVLWKRLDLGIGLQVDATISYITGKKSTQIFHNELALDSPYNTYKYRGLPPGPIANPGLSAIKAAIFPKTSPYLYYLSAEDGTTIFSKTLEEHNVAKAKYLK